MKINEQISKKINPSIKIIPFPAIDNAYIVVFAVRSERGLRSNMSFLFIARNLAVEWEPEYGPITLLYPTSINDEEGKPHWLYENCKTDWSQLAVERSSLRESFLMGDYEYIFNVLKDWSER